MRRVFLWSAACIAITTLLAGCFGFGAEPPTIPVALQATETVQTVSGTPAEKVKIYAGKAKDAQAKLQIMLDQHKAASAQQSSYFRLIPSVYAQAVEVGSDGSTTIMTEDGMVTTSADDTISITTDDGSVTTTADGAIAITMPETAIATSDAEEIAALIAEIQAYTELATEAATETTDPTEAATLLTVVQDTQADTSDILTTAADGVSAEVATVVNDATEVITTDIAEVDTAVAEATTAVENGETSVVLDVPTDVEDILAVTPGESLHMRDLRRPAFVAEKKLAHAEAHLAKLTEKLAADGVPAEEAVAILAKAHARVEAAKTAATSGDYRGALKAVREGVRDAQEIGTVMVRIEAAEARAADLKAAADAGDVAAAEKLAALQPLLDANQTLTAKIDARRAAWEAVRTDFQKEREALRETRAAARTQFIELKKTEAADTASVGAFAAERTALVQAAVQFRQEQADARMQLRTKYFQQLTALKDVPEEERAAKLTELQQSFATQQAELKTARENAATELKEQLQALRTKRQEVTDEVRDAAREIREGVREGNAEIRDALHETQKEFTEAMRAGDTEQADELKGVIREQRDVMRDHRVEGREDVKKVRDAADLPPIPPVMQEMRNELRATNVEMQQALRENRETTQAAVDAAISTGDSTAIRKAVKAGQEATQEIRDDTLEERHEIRRKIEEDVREQRIKERANMRDNEYEQ